LLTTLAILTLATILIVGMLQVSRVNRAIAHRNNQNLQATQLSQMALEQATATIRAAITEGSGTGKIWASQPGRITVVDAGNGNTAFYPLYSTATVSGDHTVTDLNAPNFNGVHPIISGSSTMAESGTAPRITAQWVNILEDPEVVASDTNKLIGRYAFWVDDETTKININTADGGLKYTGSSYGAGTPAEVNLAAVFDSAADVDLITARSGIRNGTVARAFNNSSELLTLSGSASNGFRDAWHRHYGDLTHYNRAPEINIFHEPRIYLVTTIVGPAKGATGGMPPFPQNTSHNSPAQSMVVMGINDLTASGPILQPRGGADGQLLLSNARVMIEGYYENISGFSAPLVSVYPSSGRYENLISNDQDPVCAHGVVNGNQLPWFVPFTNDAAGTPKFFPDQIRGKVRADFSQSRVIFPQAHIDGQNKPNSPWGFAAIPVNSSGGANLNDITGQLDYPLPQFFAFNHVVASDQGNSTWAHYPMPLYNGYRSSTQGAFSDNYMIGHRIAQYLKGYDSRANALDWPRLAGSGASGRDAFADKYTDRQIDSIALQIVDLFSNRLYPDFLIVGGRGQTTAGSSNQLLLPRGYLSGEPVAGVGRSPQATAVKLEATTRMNQRENLGATENERCLFDVPELRLRITVEFTLPKLFDGYAIDRDMGRVSGANAWLKNNLWQFGDSLSMFDGETQVLTSLLNLQDVPALKYMSRKITSTDKDGNPSEAQITSLGIGEPLKDYGYFSLSSQDTTVGGPAMLGGFWSNQMLQVDILAADDEGNEVIIPNSFDLTGCSWVARDPNRQASEPPAGIPQLTNIPLHAYTYPMLVDWEQAGNKDKFKGSGPNEQSTAKYPQYIREVLQDVLPRILDLGGSFDPSGEWVTPVFQMERFWSVPSLTGSANDWRPGMAKKACNVYGNVFYPGAALKNVTYSEVIQQLKTSPDPAILDNNSAIKKIFDRYGSSSKAGISRWIREPNNYYGLGLTARSIRVHGGIAIWSFIEKTPLDSVRGPYFTGEVLDANASGFNANARNRVLAAVIPFDLTIPIDYADETTVTQTRAVDDPLANKFTANWQLRASSDLLNWEPPATSNGRSAFQPAYLTSSAVTAAWSPTVSGSAMPKIARFPNTGFLQFIHTGIMPDTYINPGEISANSYLASGSGTPYRTLSFAESGPSQRGYPDWAMLDLFTVPATLQPVTDDAPAMTADSYRTLPAQNRKPSDGGGRLLEPIYLTYGGATSGRINPNAELITYDTDPERAGSAATPIYRTLPLQALFQGVATSVLSQAAYGVAPIPAPGGRLGASEANQIATAILRYQNTNRPYILQGEIANVSGAGVANYHEEVIRQVVGNLTTRSNTFSVWTVAQSIKKSTANLASNPAEYETGDAITGEVRMHYLIERYIHTGDSPVAGNLINSGTDRYPGTQDDEVDSETVSTSGTGRNLPKFSRYPLPYRYRVVYAEKITD
jgi:hypothetical protein